MKRRSWIVSMALAAGLMMPTAPALAADNAAVAVNTRDGATVFRFAFAVHRVMSGSVDETNAAVAFASCTECQTTAIAVQVVLVMGDIDEVTPTNLALAYNYGCVLCETYAGAFQFVISTDGPVHLTAEGNRTLAELRRRFLELRGADLTPEQLQTVVSSLISELAAVMQTELVPASAPQDPPAPEPSTSPEQNAGTVEPSATPSPTADSSPTPTSTTTSSPSP